MTFPEEAGISGAFLLGRRRQPGSPVSGSNIEQTLTVILKRAYTVLPSDSDPAAGSLVPRDGGPAIFEGDQPGNFLENGDFSDGLSGWSTTGGATASLGENAVTLGRTGGAGDLRRSASFGRQIRSRGFGFSVDASGDEGLPLPVPALAGGAETVSATEPGGSFPAAGSQPVAISGFARFSSTNTASSVSARLATMAADAQEVTYAAASVTAIDYESDLVAFKPEADLIVIADAPPAPASIAVDGTIRMSQAALLPIELTGLSWEDRFGTPREADGGVFDPLPAQPLPNDFNNRYYNGYRRDRRQGTSVPYPPTGAAIEIVDEDGDLYAFMLPGETPVAEHAWFRGSGQDDPCLWLRRRVAMALDTLVVEPDRDHAYAVWRAVWPVAFNPDGSGPLPLENNRAITVTMEGS